MKRKVIAVTGAIGSGKSTVASILRARGYQTIDCDVLARQVANDTQVLCQVESLLGTQSVSNGMLNRQYVREKVFKDATLHAQYQQLFFDGVLKLLNEAIKQAQGVVFVEIPVLDAFSFDWTEIWLVSSSERTTIQRVTARDGVPEQNVRDILSRQHYGAYTRVLTNDGSPENLTKEVEKALRDSRLA